MVDRSTSNREKERLAVVL
uniref:Uncharacterized protein n=1 Tax=Rhizophora mucronata TaxID=61149 RepID=A0A2P2IZD8_RHIMU